VEHGTTPKKKLKPIEPHSESKLKKLRSILMLTEENSNNSKPIDTPEKLTREINKSKQVTLAKAGTMN